MRVRDASTDEELDALLPDPKARAALLRDAAQPGIGGERDDHTLSFAPGSYFQTNTDFVVRAPKVIFGPVD